MQVGVEGPPEEEGQRDRRKGACSRRTRTRPEQTPQPLGAPGHWLGAAGHWLGALARAQAVLDRRGRRPADAESPAPAARRLPVCG
jgi:hypothetical protein